MSDFSSSNEQFREGPPKLSEYETEWSKRGYEPHIATLLAKADWSEDMINWQEDEIDRLHNEIEAGGSRERGTSPNRSCGTAGQSGPASSLHGTEQRPSKEQVEAVIRRVNALIPSSVTPATRIEIHPCDWLMLVDAARASNNEPPAVRCDHDPMSHGSTLECDERGALKCSNCTALDAPTPPPAAQALNSRVSWDDVKAYLRTAHAERIALGDEWSYEGNAHAYIEHLERQITQSRAAPEPAVTQWQSIETAPREPGDACIVAVPNYTNNDEAKKRRPFIVGEAHFVRTEHGAGCESNWYWAGEDPSDHWGPSAIYPTFWQPLPSPPSTKEGG